MEGMTASMGLACVQCYAINEATDLFEEEKLILEEICGPYHPNTLVVCSNLVGMYDAMGRLDDEIGVLAQKTQMWLCFRYHSSVRMDFEEGVGVATLSGSDPTISCLINFSGSECSLNDDLH
jgi:hypothetical protein